MGWRGERRLAGDCSGTAGASSERRPRRGRRRLLLATIVAVLLGAWSAATALASPEMPEPSYANTFFAFVYDAPLGTDADYAASRSALLARASGGPFASIGFTTYYPVDLPWSADLTDPILTSPSRVVLEGILDRLENDGLVYHVAAMLGMSRFPWIYDDGKRDDRRNAQWFLDNEIVAPGVSRGQAPVAAWVTPSRYARRLRRHMEAKTRAFAAMLAELRDAHPDTLISASGDAEAELSDARVDANLPYADQIIADYSPFAILEFRDWILRTGLYGEGGPYAGQGYKRKKRKEDFAQGASALTPENLARFNATFGTAFTSWDLEYFNWSLDDPIDGDPHAIRFKKYKKRKFAVLPTAGASHIAGGFDAPRGPRDPGAKWWKLWLKFRQAMLANFARDVATWVTSTPGGAGEPALTPDRWYSHQIPADYLSGRYPGVFDPSLRLQTSASTLATAFIPPAVGSVGVTILDRFELAGFGPPGGYNRTSAFALDDIEARGFANWGIPEYSPSWPIDVAPDTDVARIAAQWHRVHGAGAHMAALTPWPHFINTANGDALGAFLAEVSDAPRASGYVPAARDLFVKQLYADLLGRIPTPNEVAAAVGAIADGSEPRPRLIADLIASQDVQETSRDVLLLYLGLLGRQPELQELDDRVAYVTGGGCTGACRQQRRRDIVEAMAATAEYQARFGGTSPTADVFVTTLYQGVLQRDPSASDVSVWTGLLANGIFTRVQVAQLFAEGAEHVALVGATISVQLTYLSTLARLPTSDELTEWSARVAGGLSTRGLAQTFLLSPEYRARFAS